VVGALSAWGERRFGQSDAIMDCGRQNAGRMRVGGRVPTSPWVYRVVFLMNNDIVGHTSLFYCGSTVCTVPGRLSVSAAQNMWPAVGKTETDQSADPPIHIC